MFLILRSQTNSWGNKNYIEEMEYSWLEVRICHIRIAYSSEALRTQTALYAMCLYKTGIVDGNHLDSIYHFTVQSFFRLPFQRLYKQDNKLFLWKAERKNTTQITATNTKPRLNENIFTYSTYAPSKLSVGAM